ANPTEQELGNLNGAGADPTEQELENLNGELENLNGAGADLTEQDLGNLNGAGADPTEQELRNLNLGFCREGELDTNPGDSVERMNLGANPRDSAERTNSGTNPRDSVERVNSGTDLGDLAERVNSGTNPGNSVERVNSGTNPGDSTERVNSGANPEDLTERANSGTNPRDSTERVNSGANPGDLAGRTNSGTNLGDSTERVNLGANPRDLAERANSGTNLGDSTERVNSGINHGDSTERVLQMPEVVEDLPQPCSAQLVALPCRLFGRVPRGRDYPDSGLVHGMFSPLQESGQLLPHRPGWKSRYLFVSDPVWGFRLDWSAHPIGNTFPYLSEEETVLIGRLKGILSSSHAIKEMTELWLVEAGFSPASRGTIILLYFNLSNYLLTCQSECRSDGSRGATRDAKGDQQQGPSNPPRCLGGWRFPRKGSPEVFIEEASRCTDRAGRGCSQAA
ncbi:hypothetical protein B296_00049245, partial [Ensete ventricosum]